MTGRQGAPGGPSLPGRGPRRWSIGVRVSLTFALVSATLCGLVLAGVAWATGQGVARSVSLVEQQVVEGTAFSLDPDPDGPAAAEAGAPGPAAAEVGEGGLRSVDVVVDLARGQQLLWSVVGTVVAALAAGGVGLLVSRRLLRPLDEVVATTRRVTASTLHERIAHQGPRDEIARVADTIDDLLDRLEASFEAQRRFVAYASHELRTPLAVQRAALQIGLDDPAAADVAAVRDQLLEVNRRSEHLVESLLALAAADRGLPGAGGPVGLRDVVEGVVTGLADAARASCVDLRVEVARAATIDADEVLLRQLVRNLVANALEYNRPGGWVRVADERHAVLVVENTGPVVAPDLATRLTQPFVRADGDGRRDDHDVDEVAAPHSGLGLAIVASIARAHGWAVSVTPRHEGGLRVVVR